MFRSSKTLSMVYLLVATSTVVATTVACEHRDGQSADVSPVGPSAVATNMSTPTPTNVAQDEESTSVAQEEDSTGVAQDGESTDEAQDGETASTNALTLPPLTFPKPTLTGIDRPSAAPGTILNLYGTNLNPPGTYFRPTVHFGSSVYRSADVVSNTQIRVTVPSSGGTVQLYVETVGGKTAAKSFTYQRPALAGLAPASGVRGHSVTLTGTGFGVQAQASNDWVMFGASMVAVPTSWADGRIVANSPIDFGTGASDRFFQDLASCIASFSPAKLVLRLLRLGCSDLWNSTKALYQLSTSTPGFVTKTVPVVVHTAAGTSNALNFTYKVQVQTQ